MPKTVRVTNKGKRVNAWNCGVIVIYGPAAAAVLALAEVAREVWS